MSPRVRHHLRMFGVMLGITLVFTLMNASIRAQFEPTVDPATITISTDCTDTTVQAFGGDLGYPGPSQVVCERDSLGTVVHVDLRVFDERRSWVFLPMVSR